ncbi:MAG: hypothetical protein WC474_09450 [Hydrogenophilaceae bacterium]
MALILHLGREQDDDLGFLPCPTYLDPVDQLCAGLSDAPENQTSQERNAEREPTQPSYHLLKNLH